MFPYHPTLSGTHLTWSLGHNRTPSSRLGTIPDTLLPCFFWFTTPREDNLCFPPWLKANIQSPSKQCKTQMPPHYDEVSHSVPNDHFKIKIVSSISSVQYRESQLIAPGIKHMSKGHQSTISTKKSTQKTVKVSRCKSLQTTHHEFQLVGWGFFLLPSVLKKKTPKFWIKQQDMIVRYSYTWRSQRVLILAASEDTTLPELQTITWSIS